MAGKSSESLSVSVERMALLRNVMKRDPDTYVEEFRQQLRHFEAEVELLKLSPGNRAPTFCVCVDFLAHVCVCYPTHAHSFPGTLIALLQTHLDALHPDTRRSIVQALMLLNNKGAVHTLPLVRAFTSMSGVQDKGLRALMRVHVVHAIRTHINGEHKDDAANRALQAAMYPLVADSAPAAAAHTCLSALIQLYTNRTWTDARTVNVIASALTSTRVKIMVMALKFFLGIGSGDTSAGDMDDSDASSSSDDEKPTAASVDRKALRDAEHAHAHSKHTRRRARQTARLVAGLKKQAAKAAGKRAAQPVFPALQLIHDPQGLAERMFASLRSPASGERFEIRLLMMNFVSRLIGTHKLILLPFYSFLQKYLNAHQSNVTQVLAYLVQACHDLVPPDEMVPVIRTIANNFVTDRCSPEVITVGLNAIREVFAHSPVVLEEPGMGDLVSDLVMYKKYNNRGVVAAARSVLNLVRDVYPSLLKRRERGKEAALSGAAARPTAFGMQRVATGVEGADLLALLLAQKAARGVDSDEDSDSDNSSLSQELAALLEADEHDHEHEHDDECEHCHHDEDMESSDGDAEDSEGDEEASAMDEDAEGGAAKPRASRRKHAEEDADSDEGAEDGADEEDEDAEDDDDDDDDDDEDMSDEEEDASGAEVEDSDEESDDESESAEEPPAAAGSKRHRNDRVAAPPAARKRARQAAATADAHEEPEAEEESGAEDMQSHASGPSHGVSSRGSNTAALLAAVRAAATDPIEASRFLTAKDFKRIRKIRHKLAERGVTVTNASDLVSLLSGAGPQAKDDYTLRTRKKRGARPANREEDSDDGSEDGADQLAMPGTSFAPPVAAMNPENLEHQNIRKKRLAAERLMTVMQEKSAKYEGKKAGGGLTNKEKARFKNYLMLRKSSNVQAKLKTSLVAQQKTLRKRMRKQTTMDRRKKQRRRRA